MPLQAFMKIELVTHCYQYASLLKYQLSSLVLNPPPADIGLKVTVFYTEDDTETSNVLRSFLQFQIPNLEWNWRSQPPLELCRRSIGRNLAALASDADWIWFTDADYWFGSECWASFRKLGTHESCLIYPRYVSHHRTHAMGDVAIHAAHSREGLIGADPAEFEPKKMRKAIGGIQIAKGEVCREKGYLKNGRKAQTPVRELLFERNKADVWFRRDLGTGGAAADIDEVYRIRHSQAGRYTPGLKL